jgi:hypothetical protein
MRHKNKPQIEEDIFITTPGPVPKEPEHYVNRCYCEQCLASRTDFSYDEQGTEEALKYGRALAQRHNLPLDVSNISDGGHDYLD